MQRNYFFRFRHIGADNFGNLMKLMKIILLIHRAYIIFASYYIRDYMRKSVYILLLLLLSGFLCQKSSATTPADSIRISLVTCSPGPLIYEVYGHTAIRVQNFTRDYDIVYHYGVFDFESPHFLWRWLKGQTDYMIGVQYWDIFTEEYASRGADVYLQQLNLSGEEACRLADALYTNSLPENRKYRYNFFSNNCATMALDKIEAAFDGTFSHSVRDYDESFRSILHRFNGIEPWYEFGVDIVLGADADKRISGRETSFAPLLLMKLMATARVTDSDGVSRPAAANFTQLAPPARMDFQARIITPIQAMMLLFLLTLFICCLEWNIGRRFRCFDIVLFSIQGLIGLLLFFLYFFSDHPTTCSNWLILVLNPISIVCIPIIIYNLKHNYLDYFFIFNFLAITLFIIFSSRMPQYISGATLVMLAVFALRSLSGILYQIREKAEIHKMSIFNFIRKHKSAAVPVILLALSVSAGAQSVRQAPRLVVGIVVDQLDGEYAKRLMPLFGDDGFRRFWYHGYNLSNAGFEYDCKDRASAVASIYTGSSPFYHGIVGEKWVERQNLMTVGAVDDSNVSGINTIDRFSPRNLQVLTITDQMKLASHGSSIVCSIAAEADAAIFAGGHDPDVVLWMDDSDGKWCTSSYYGSIPSWADDEDTEYTWKPSLPMSYYMNNYNPQSRSFSHDLKHCDTKTMKASPVANRRVIDMAEKAIDAMHLGASGAPDFLALTLYAGGFSGQPASLESIELQDTYARIDQDIAHLIKYIEDKMGTGSVLFFLTSTGYKEDASTIQNNTRMPTGTVRMERVTALLNLYLSAIYKQGEYISTYNGTQLYLNMNLIKQQDISIQEIYGHCVDMLVQMEGIKSVFTQRDLLSGNLNQQSGRIRNSLNSDCSGDLVIEVTPGWTVYDDKHQTEYVERRSRMNFPVMLYGAGVTPDINGNDVSAFFLASTLAWILGVPTPSACSTLPMTGFW